MKRCPQCNHLENDEALRFCRVDGATLVNVASIGTEAGTAQLGSLDATELHTSILPHTQSNVARATDATTALQLQTPETTGSLAKGGRKPIVIAVVITAMFAVIAAVIIGWYFSRRSSAPIDSIAVLPFENKSND